MSIRTRKFIGTVGILLLLAIYLPLAMVIGANHFAHSGSLWQIAYFLAAGMAWVVPAGLIMRWMIRGSGGGEA